MVVLNKSEAHDRSRKLELLSIRINIFGLQLNIIINLIPLVLLFAFFCPCIYFLHTFLADCEIAKSTCITSVFNCLIFHMPNLSGDWNITV
ncbi:Schizosaccharomyces pombe specific protein [Schizosaccharomyces pombe]|uniref:Uncharacterized protein C330.19c n=1 Tax=Schizosaccharomyces pombe (strain 972 / ATCC 24843) TaxID=284812 RepID=YJ8J_SCHPO|nr:uncharacterized protein SPCC330.19c [Schizosaccharomyces pombe]Q8J1M7.1 RecName: Full=Uncharacterized protein C330.19c [Schizosaccharomyces pombe 972h-]CAD47846.1 sequence orphan [Schizosaccharomyces pombe]|eukprot:NP_001343000.1 uncharacterized protein SPCC330.19c [Schizosaccharomyces pombe]